MRLAALEVVFLLKSCSKVFTPSPQSSVDFVFMLSWIVVIDYFDLLLFLKNNYSPPLGVVLRSYCNFHPCSK
jgi:hypothetical protein